LNKNAEKNTDYNGRKDRKIVSIDRWNFFQREKVLRCLYSCRLGV